MPRTETPGFARNLANRWWAMMLGRGLVHPLDLHHAKNPPSHPAVLAALEQWLIEHRYDIEGCLREIALSRCYQLSGELPAGAESPVDAFAVAKLRALTPEQMRWSLLRACGRLDSSFVRAEEQLKKTKPTEVEAKLKDFKRRVRKTPILMSGGTTKGVPEAMKKLLEVIDTSRRLGRANDEPGVTTEDWRP